MAKLLPRQARFVAEYLKDLNGTQAAIRSGYSGHTAESQSSRLLRNAKVKAAVDEAIAKRAGKLELTADRVLADIERISQSAEEGGDLNVALKGRELLGKHLKLFTEKHEHSGPNGEALSITIDIGARR